MTGRRVFRVSDPSFTDLSEQDDDVFPSPPSEETEGMPSGIAFQRLSTGQWNQETFDDWLFWHDLETYNRGVMAAHQAIEADKVK